MPTDAVPQILTRIQDSISALRAEVGEFRTSVEGRLDRLEQTLVSIGTTRLRQ